MKYKCGSHLIPARFILLSSGPRQARDLPKRTSPKIDNQRCIIKPLMMDEELRMIGLVGSPAAPFRAALPPRVRQHERS